MQNCSLGSCTLLPPAELQEIFSTAGKDLSPTAGSSTFEQIGIFMNLGIADSEPAGYIQNASHFLEYANQPLVKRHQNAI